MACPVRCRAVLQAVIASEDGGVADTIDLRHAKGLDEAVRRQLLDRAMETQDMDNELFLTKISRRLDRCSPCKITFRAACVCVCYVAHVRMEDYHLARHLRGYVDGHLHRVPWPHVVRTLAV